MIEVVIGKAFKSYKSIFSLAVFCQKWLHIKANGCAIKWNSTKFATA